MTSVANRGPNPLQGVHRFGRVEQVQPVVRSRDGPTRKFRVPSSGRLRRCACPLPILGMGDKLPSEGVALHVAAQLNQVPVALHGDGLVAALIDGPTAGAAVRSPQGLRVCGSQPLHEGGEIPIMQGPQDQMPVIRHEGVREDTHGYARHGVQEDLDEAPVVRLTLKKHQVLNGSIHDMEDQLSAPLSGSSGHIPSVVETDGRPFPHVSNCNGSAGWRRSPKWSVSPTIEGWGRRAADLTLQKLPPAGLDKCAETASYARTALADRSDDYKSVLASAACM